MVSETLYLNGTNGMTTSRQYDGLGHLTLIYSTPTGDSTFSFSYGCPSWQRWSTLPGTGSDVTVSPAITEAPTRFFRVKVQ